jgi:ABC-2 type transport system ATP-binding protein
MNNGRIVMQGAVDEIQRKVFESKKICISVLDNREQATRLIGEFPNAKIVNARDNEIIVEIDAGPAELAELNSLLVSKGIKVFSFHEDKTDLEDLFMKISSDNE